MELLDASMVACESIVAREECCDGDVLDMRLAFFRRTLETGNGESNDLFSSFSSKQQVGYRRLRGYETREDRDSILEPRLDLRSRMHLELVKMALPIFRHIA